MVVTICFCLLVIILLVNLTKFIHLLCVLGLLSCVLFCMRLIGSGISDTTLHNLNRLNTFILQLSLVAMLSGTLLVYPKHFTFHTPWIQAAYLFLILFCCGIFLLKISLKKIKITRGKQYGCTAIYFLLFTILIFITHDAVTKTTFLQ